MTGSRQGHGCTNSGRAVAALPTRSPRRSALPGLGLFALLAVLVAGVGASSASAYECYSGNPNCASEGPLQHLVNLGGGGVEHLLHADDDHLFRVLAAEGRAGVPEGVRDCGHGFLQGA